MALLKLTTRCNEGVRLHVIGTNSLRCPLMQLLYPVGSFVLSFETLRFDTYEPAGKFPPNPFPDVAAAIPSRLSFDSFQ